MKDNFYATFKCITGEEVLAEVCPTEENGENFFLVSNAIVINETSMIDHHRGIMATGLSPRKWMNFSAEDMTIVNKNHIVSMSELDKFGVEFYEKALVAARCSSPVKKKINTKKDHIGYLGSIEKTRNRLEKIFNKNKEKN